MFRLEKVIGSKAPLGVLDVSIERIKPRDHLAEEVFGKILDIIGDDLVAAKSTEPVRHVSVEDAMRELLEISRSSAQCAPSASQ